MNDQFVMNLSLKDERTYTEAIQTHKYLSWINLNLIILKYQIWAAYGPSSHLVRM
jgi:hypothetical protein